MQRIIECRPHGMLARLAARVVGCVAAWGAARGVGATRPRPHVGALRLAGLALLLLACALLPLARRTGAAEAPQAPRHADGFEWPRQFDGRPLRPLAMSAVELRFAAAFPGAIGRFSDGERLLVLRAVQRPTRMLHPAADCYRGLGYTIAATRLERDASERLWRCFEATRGKADGPRLRVCERIEDAQGGAFTDTSAWFWAALFERSVGPWQAVTTVEVL